MQHLISEMMFQVRKDVALCAPQYDMIEMVLREYCRDKIAHIWSVVDVQDLARREHGCTLLPEDARYVLMRAGDKLDSTIGMSWDVLDVFLSDALNEGLVTIPTEVEDADY